MDVKSVNASNYESESNNTFVTANTISYGTQMLGMISSSSDVDYFKFTASNGNVLHVNLSKVPSGRDYDIQLFYDDGSSNKQLLKGSYKASNANEYIKWNATQSGTYYIKVFGINGSNHSSHYYSLSVVRGDITTANSNSSYNRSNAKWYAENYAAWPGNTSFYNFGSLGGDCTNFASQMVNYGGMSMLGNTSTYESQNSWFYYGANLPNRTYTWTSANWFRQHFANMNSNGFNRTYRYRIYTVESALANWNEFFDQLYSGDIVQHMTKEDGNSYHSRIIHGYVYNSTYGVNDLYYAQHSIDNPDSWYKNGSLYNRLVSLRNSGRGYEWVVLIRIKL